MPGKQPAGVLEAECVVKGFQGGRRREGVRMQGVVWPLVGLTAFLSSPQGQQGALGELLRSHGLALVACEQRLERAEVEIGRWPGNHAEVTVA